MRRHGVLGMAVVVVAAGAGMAVAEYESWTQLSLSTCQVDRFLSLHPKSNGTGVVIAVLDTGVDPSIPGLTRTPDGEVKVIDVQDFTGQGDLDLLRVPLSEAKDAVIDYDDDGVAVHYGLPTLPETPAGEERLFWMTTIDEHRFVNSDVPDLNDDGDSDDAFAVLVTALASEGDDQALVFVDTDVDRSFANEKPLRSYKLAYDTFTMHRARPEAQIEPVAFAVNVFLKQRKVVLVYDDGAHGTHVAGIAAGYQINNQSDFHGVAPGAKLMSLKIGKNSVGGVTSTESVKKALEYAARYARLHGVPVVCNMSYGVESTLEGESDIDVFLDKLLAENPLLVFCTSAGNEGPGLSSVGTPSAASRAISVAALLAPDSARDVMGFAFDEPVVTVFSSRGGELVKPEIATPGWATSTVPRWVQRGDYWAGTSMASPYAAGLCALLISHVRQEDAEAAVRACDVRRALCLSARRPSGATFLDAGCGVPNVVEAAKILPKLVRAAAADPVVAYDVSTASPAGPGGKAPAAFWRGAYFPSDEPQTFTIEPVFGPVADAGQRTSFTRKYTLRSQAPWCKLTQESFYLRSAQSARVFVEYDAEQLQEPGLYVGVVEALHDDLPAMYLVSSVVVPYRFTAAENYTQRFAERVVHGWVPDRYFVAVPPGASAMKLTLSAPDGEQSEASLSRVFTPDGTQLRDRSYHLDTEAGVREVTWLLSEELEPGVWELPVVANRPDRDWPYELEVKYFGLAAEPAVIETGSGTKGSVTVTQMFEEPLAARAEGRIEGFRQREDATFEGLDDELSYTVTLDERFDALRIKLEMTPEAYATTTDIGVAVEDGDGEAVYSSGFSWRTFEATVRKPNPRATVTWTVKIRSGFAVADDQRETPMTVRLDRMLAEPAKLNVEWGDTSSMTFVPAAPVKLDYRVAGELPDAPKGTKPVGYVQVRTRGSDDVAVRVPIDLKP